MASYGNIYEFVFDSTNGAEIEIVILRRDYNGQIYRRSLGRAPQLRLENNEHVFGTSLEIYAECLVDGEFASLYSSSAYEHLVEVYKDGTLLWTGFVSPELYSEPDIDPPYDVQIIATDGLGELKNYIYEPSGMASLWSHLSAMLSHTGLDLQYNLVSALSYQADNISSAEADLLNFHIDLEHEAGNSCYDVLQRLLSGLNMSVTQYNGRWLFFRETDLISLVSSEGVKAYDRHGFFSMLPIRSFGSSQNHEWWPVGQLSIVIEPAKNRIVLESPNHYKDNALSSSDWSENGGSYYDNSEGAFVLPSKNSGITQYIYFEGQEVGYPLVLRIRARNVGSGDADQDLGITVKIDGREYTGKVYQYYLQRIEGSDRASGAYRWDTKGDILLNLATPQSMDTDEDAQDIEIRIGLSDYVEGTMQGLHALNIELRIFNPAGKYAINVYDIALAKSGQYEGLQGNVQIDNNAREEASTVDLSLTDGSRIPTAGYYFMTGIPMLPNGASEIKRWSTIGIDSHEYLRFMAHDYSRAIALPKMRYTGILNVPGISILPMLFQRNGTYYLPTKYSYNLVDDELDIDMISISAADVSLDRLEISQIAESRGTMPSGSGGSSGGGIGGTAAGELYLGELRDVNTKEAKENSLLQKKEQEWKAVSIDEILNDYFANTQSLGDWFFKDEDGNICTVHPFITESDLASGAEGDPETDTGVDIIVDWNDYDESFQQALGANLGVQLLDGIASLESRIETLENNAGGGSGDIPEGSDYVGRAEYELAISNIDGAISGILDSLTSLGERADDLEARIETLENNGGGGGNEPIEGYATEDWVRQNFVSNEAISQDYYTRTEVDGLLKDITIPTDYYSKSQIDERLEPIEVWKDSLSPFITVDEDGNVVISSNLIVIGDLATTAAAEEEYEPTDGYATEQWVSQNFVTNDFLVSEYYNAVEVEALLEGEIYAQTLSSYGGLWAYGGIYFDDDDYNMIEPDEDGLLLYSRSMITLRTQRVIIETRYFEYDSQDIEYRVEKDFRVSVNGENMMYVNPDGMGCYGELTVNGEIVSPTIDSIVERIEAIEERLGM